MCLGTPFSGVHHVGRIQRDYRLSALIVEPLGHVIRWIP